MRLFLTVVLITIIASTLQAQIARVDDYDQKYIKEIAGSFTHSFHEANYGQAGTRVAVFLMPGEYYLFCGEQFIFKENIFIEDIKPQVIELKEVNNRTYHFKVEGKSPINFEILMNTTLRDKNKYLHFFSFHRVYDPHKVKDISLPFYTSFKQEKFDLEASNKPYSVHLLCGSTRFLSEELISFLNQIQSQYAHKASFFCLTAENEESVNSFLANNSFNWNMVKLNSGHRNTFTIDKLSTEPSFYVIDHHTRQIIYYYFGLNDSENLLRAGLKDLK